MCADDTQDGVRSCDRSYQKFQKNVGLVYASGKVRARNGEKRDRCRKERKAGNSPAWKGKKSF